MRYIIFGAGNTGEIAFNYFGRNRVLCFADNNKTGTVLHAKEVISFNEMLKIYSEQKQIIIVISSNRYWKEMEYQIKDVGLQRYFVFFEADMYLMNRVLPYYYLYKRPIYLSYTQILSHYDLLRYSKIAIYGANRYLPYLITEIMDRNPYADIKVILPEECEHKYNTLGIREGNLDSCIEWMDVFIINIKQCQSNIREEIEEVRNGKFDVLDLFDINSFETTFVHKELAVYKNIHKGQRIFIIGTGPSLRTEDLDILHKNKEICIACNKIYRVYDKTLWRADYYGFLDGRVIEDCINDISDIPGKVFLGDSYHYDINDYYKNMTYFHYIEESWYPNYPRFSEDFSRGFYAGGSTTYSFGIQLAAYLGAKEIYLLGMDHCVNGKITNPENHFIKEYYRDNEEAKYKTAVFRDDVITKAYEWAEIYSRKHGFRIYNATRGGKLEVFERVDFDSLFTNSE